MIVSDVMLAIKQILEICSQVQPKANCLPVLSGCLWIASTSQKASRKQQKQGAGMVLSACSSVE